MRTANAGQLTITDDGRIVLTDTGEEIPLDEPVFLLRARNPMAAEMLGDYAGRASTRRISVLMQEVLHRGTAEFLQFRREHPARMQVPQAPLPSTGPIPRIKVDEVEVAARVAEAMEATEPPAAPPDSGHLGSGAGAR